MEDWSDFFYGGVPPGQMLKIELENLEQLIEEDPSPNGLRSTPGLCLIGLVAHFEAYFKHVFGAVGNIHPPTLDRFASKRRQVDVSLKDIRRLKGPVEYQLGFLISDEYSFGDAKSINSLFRDLIGITPFSKDEKRRYDEILAERNLLVHNGGVLTAQSVAQDMIRHTRQKRSFFDSVAIEPEHVLDDLRFADEIARKTTDATHSALGELIQESVNDMFTAQRKALNMINKYNL
jgi:hypothetical protein